MAGEAPAMDWYWSAQFPHHLFAREGGQGTLWKVPYKVGGWHERESFQQQSSQTDFRPMDAPRKLDLFAEQVAST